MGTRYLNKDHEFNKLLESRASEMRKNPSYAEKRFTPYLEQLECRYDTQVVLSPYIVDYRCSKHRVIVEVDGRQHLDNIDYDAKRDRSLIKKRYKVVRINASAAMYRPYEALAIVAKACGTEAPTKPVSDDTAEPKLVISFTDKLRKRLAEAGID